MSDLTERLLSGVTASNGVDIAPETIIEAAARIASLEAELDRVRGALENIAGDEKPELGNRNTNDLLARMYWEYARQALSPGGE